jgi:hypothetical protein
MNTAGQNGNSEIRVPKSEVKVPKSEQEHAVEIPRRLRTTSGVVGQSNPLSYPTKYQDLLQRKAQLHRQGQTQLHRLRQAQA